MVGNFSEEAAATLVSEVTLLKWVITKYPEDIIQEYITSVYMVTIYGHVTVETLRSCYDPFLT